MFEAVGASQLVGDWSWLEKYHVLPEEGGLLDQSPRWVEAMQLIGGEVARLKEAKVNGETHNHHHRRR